MRRFLLVLLLLVLPNAVMAQRPVPTLEDRQKVLFDHLYEKVRRDLPDLASPELQRYVDTVGMRLWQAGEESHKLTVTVADSPDALSNVIPGRLLFLSAPLFARLETEAELAALLAHQIGHLQVQVPVERPPNLSSIPLIFMGSAHGLCIRFVAEGTPALYHSSLIKREQEADVRALLLLRAAGYDPSALAEVRRRTPAASRLLPGEVELVAMTHALDRAVVTSSTFDRLRAEVTETLRQRQPRRRPRFR